MRKRSEQLSRGGNFLIFIFEVRGSVGPARVCGPWGAVWVGQGWGLEVHCGASGFSREGVGGGESLFVPEARWGRGGKMPSLPGPCSSCRDHGGGGLQGAGKGLCEKGISAPEPLHPEELWLGGVSSRAGALPIPREDPGGPWRGQGPGVLSSCPLHFSPPRRVTPPTASLRTLENQTQFPNCSPGI